MWLSFFLFELRSTARRGADLLQAPLFLLMGAMCFPLAGNPQAASLYATSILWVLLLLSNFMMLQGIWDKDADSGGLEQMLLYPITTTDLISAKYLTFWLCYSLPALIILPVISLLLQHSLPILPIFLGSILFSAIGFLAATLTINQNQSPILRALLILPLYIPILIFGAGGSLPVLAGLVFLYIPICLGFSVIAVRDQIS
jgi:heme exporter protein B